MQQSKHRYMDNQSGSIIPPHLEPVRHQWIWEDDWTGITDSAKRKKLQNRLNQRAYRMSMWIRACLYCFLPPSSIRLLTQFPEVRQQAKSRGQSGTRASEQAVIATVPAPPHESHEEDTEVVRVICPDSGASPTSRKRGMRHCNMHDVVNIVELLARRAYIEYCMGMRNIGNLPTLTKINVFRGLFRNAEILGSTAECIAYDAMSSATAYAPTPGGSISLSCPDSLKPTDLQRSTKHNPWIDLFPLPRMRDNCIFAFHGPDPLDNDDLRSDVLEVGLDAPSAADMQLLVWGNPWDPRNWEVSEAFVKKWGMLLRGCDEILQSTNYWRQMRGEKKLAIEYSA